MGSSFDKLFKIIIDNSISKDWNGAVLEWTLIDTEEDEYVESKCICGKENIRYLHQIQNSINGNILFPIGSSCIKKFDRPDLNELISVKEKLFKLYHAVGNKKFLELSSDLFSRKLIKYLYEQGAFDSENKEYSSKDSYEFFLKMFNKRNGITVKQDRKVKAILLNNIKPFVIKQTSSKIIQCEDKWFYKNDMEAVDLTKI